MLSLIYERPTWLHRRRAGAKLLALGGLSVGVFALSALWALGLALCGLALVYLSCGLGFARAGLGALRPLRFFLIILALWHGVLGDIAGGLAIAAHLVLALGLANLLTLSTRFDDMMEAIIAALLPLRHFGIKGERFALAAALLLRFTPVLAQKGAQLQMAWRARSARRAGWNILVPWLIVAIDDAEHVALALRARGGVPY